MHDRFARVRCLEVPHLAVTVLSLSPQRPHNRGRQDPVCLQRQGKARLAARAVRGLAALAIMVLGQLDEAGLLIIRNAIEQ